MQVHAACNRGWVKHRRTLRGAVGPWAFMTSFWPVSGRPAFWCTPEAIGRRRLEVVGLDVPATVLVRQGRVVIERRERP